MKRNPLAISLTVIGWLALAVAAGAAEKRILTLEQCLELGLANSKGLHASQMAVEASAGKLREVKASRLPSLKFSVNYTRLSEVPPFEVNLPFAAAPSGSSTFVVSPSYFNNYTLKLSFQQPLFAGFRLQAGESMAGLNAGASEQDLSRDRNEAVFAIQSAYWSLVKARESRKVVDENVEQVKAHLADVRGFFDQGLLTKNDVLKVEVQLSSVRLAQLDAKNAQEMAAVWLNNLMGAPLDQDIEPAASNDILAASALDTPEEWSSLEKLLAAAQQNRPELRAMDFRVRAGQEGVKVAQAGWYPQVLLTGNYYSLRPNPRILPAQDKFTDTWDLGLTVSFDIWNWNTAGLQTSQARAQLAQAADALGQMKDAVAVEVRLSWLAFQESKEKIGLARLGVEQAAENLRVARDRFMEGVAINTEVLDAETALLQAKLSYTQALVDSELARARLRKAVGT